MRERRKFRIRLWLVKRLLASLIDGCLDEFPEFDAISEGVAHLHSAIENDMPVSKVRTKPVPDMELVSACRLIIENGRCNDRIACEPESHEDGRPKCPNCGKRSSNSWSCKMPAESAKQWLREHGIKEE